MTNLQPRAIKAAHAQAQAVASKIKQAFKDEKVKSWDDLSTHLGITVPPAFTTIPFTWPAVAALADNWKHTAITRLQADLSAPSGPIKLRPAEVCNTYGEITILPEQQAVLDYLLPRYLNRSLPSALNPGIMGSGKTFLVGAVISELAKRNLHFRTNYLGVTLPAPIEIPYSYVVFAPPSVCIQHKNVFTRMGLGDLLARGTLAIIPYSQIAATYGKSLCDINTYTDIVGNYLDEDDAQTRETTVVELKPTFDPMFINWDECHRLNTPTTIQTKFALAVQRMPAARRPLQLFTSATPFITVNHTRVFVLSTGARLMDMQVAEATFNQFARLFCENPSKRNKAASERLRGALNPYIVPFPYVRWRSRAINRTMVIPFASERDRQIEADSYAEFLARKNAAGENTDFGSFEAAIELQRHAMTCEPLRIPAMVELALAAHARGLAPVIGCEYREFVGEYVRRLVMDHGIPRSKITVIWGGRRRWRTELLLDEDTLVSVALEISKDPENVDPDLLRRFKETLAYKQDRIKRAETAEEQFTRLAAMSELGLSSNQTLYQRNEEVTRFQTGESEFAVFTLAAGGVGLSLDQDKPTLRPRVGYFTPCWSGPRFQQALGRLIRRMTVSDVEQFMCFLKGTVEETHLAPAVDSNLANIAVFSGNFDNIIQHAMHKATRFTYRTEAQIRADVEKDESQVIELPSDEEDTDD